MRTCGWGNSSSKAFGISFADRPKAKRTMAMVKFPAPTDLTTLRGFLGLVNQLGHFLPDLAHLTVDLRQLLKKDIFCGYNHTRRHLNSFIKY
jgi:hypothetical protein